MCNCSSLEIWAFLSSDGQDNDSAAEEIFAYALTDQQF